jgi:CRP/FNR family transcriptional regulator, anaerobic regulatory protein
MYQSLIDVISRSSRLTAADISLCKSYFEPMNYDKATIVAHQGRVPSYLYFISSGYMRLYYLDTDGEEVTTHISTPHTFITPFLSFIHQREAREHVATITDCTLLRIAQPNLAKLISESDPFKIFSLVIFEQAIASTEVRANDLATLSAEQRYKKLIEQQQEIVQYVPLQHIASYLGMKPESLSRIRRQIIS